METHVECTAGSVLHASARRYAEKFGWPVFPCVPMRKVPATPNGFHSASSNPAQVNAWWSSNPNCNIGLPPGRAGYIVINVDVKHGSPGMSTAAALGILDIPTLTAVTPNGGLHLYFTRPAGLDHVGNRHDLGAGLDVRADSGYVSVPPSILGSGSRYTWRRSTPVELPGHIASLLVSQPAAPAHASYRAHFGGNEGTRLRRARSYLAKVPPATPGTRNDTAFRVAAWLMHDLELADEHARASSEK